MFYNKFSRHVFTEEFFISLSVGRYSRATMEIEGNRLFSIAAKLFLPDQRERGVPVTPVTCNVVDDRYEIRE